ncbi:hypothetical protein ACFGYR_04000 [Pasteurella multocida]
MANFIVSYDLRNHRDYTKLIQAIRETYRLHSKVLESVWYIKSTQSAVQIRDYLRQYIDGDDGIAVFDITNNSWATWNCNHEEMQRLWNF